MQEGLQKNKHSSLLGQFVILEETEVLWIWPQGKEKYSSLRGEIVIYNCKKFYKMAPFCFSRTYAAVRKRYGPVP